MTELIAPDGHGESLENHAGPQAGDKSSHDEAALKDEETILDRVAGGGSDEWFHSAEESSDGGPSPLAEIVPTESDDTPPARSHERTTAQLLRERATSMEDHGLSLRNVDNSKRRFTLFPRGRPLSDSGLDDGEGRDRLGFESVRTDAPSQRIRGLIEKIIKFEFPEQDRPTARKVINVGRLPNNQARYGPGSWVEIRGPDMVWRLDMITRVCKQAPDDWDWNAAENEGKQPEWKFYYHAGEHRMLQADELRSPEEGLRRIFGLRPWVWQQWACIKIENELRFQEGHQDDFAQKDLQKYAADLWDRWLYHPSNSEFKAVFEDDRVGDLGRNELVNHIMKPFKLMDTIKEDKDKWDFEGDPSISVYTYLCTLGRGLFPFPFVVLIVQLFIPVCLFLAVGGCNLIEWNSKLFDSCPNTDMQELGYDLEQYKDGTYHGMAFLVCLMYLVKVVPDMYYEFYNTLGTTDAAYSRLLSLRQILSSQGDDTISQLIGYKMENYMNTAYIALLYLLNIWIIFHTDQVLDIVLDFLAFEFIARFDEELTKSQWWDPGQRWITAGAMELVLQTTIRRQWLDNLDAFCMQFEIDRDFLLEACGENSSFLKNKEVASKDKDDVVFMTKEETLDFWFTNTAKKLRNWNAVEEYEAPEVHYGMLDRILQKDHAMFNRFWKYRTWSRWEVVLFASPVPKLNDLFEMDERSGRPSIARSLEEIRPTPDKPFLNFYPELQGGQNVFLGNVLDVLLLKGYVRGLMQKWKKREYGSFLFLWIDGIIQWLAYFTFIIFPVMVLLAIFAIIWSLINRA